MAHDIQVKEIPDQPTATIRVTAPPGDMGKVFGALLPEIAAFLASKGIHPTGPAFGVFHEYTDERVDVQMGFPVAGVLEGEGRIVGGILPGGAVAWTVHEGSYTTLGEAHRALEAWLKKEGREPAGPPREIYVTGPQQTDHSVAWRTEVVYPIR